jgi:hypothetical protein
MPSRHFSVGVFFVLKGRIASNDVVIIIMLATMKDKVAFMKKFLFKRTKRIFYSALVMQSLE